MLFPAERFQNKPNLLISCLEEEKIIYLGVFGKCKTAFGLYYVVEDELCADYDVYYGGAYEEEPS